jgi:hypothetical protein
MALLGATASGIETLPANTTPPVLSPDPPIEGVTEVASKGGWSGEPTSFTYAWYRCSGTGACVSIPSATSNSYTVSNADEAHTLRVVVTATNGVGSGSAISAATAIPTRYYWNSCKKTGTGKYTDATCSVVGAGGFEWTKIAAATPTTFSAASTTSFALKLTLFGAPVAISCSAQASSGTLENPTESKTANVSGTSFKQTGCTVTEPPKCSVPGAALTFVTLKGRAIEFEKGPSIKFEPSSGTTLESFEFTGSECVLAGTVFSLTGSFYGIDKPSTSSLEFTKASSAGLRVGATAVALEGTTKIQTAAGEALKLTE